MITPVSSAKDLKFAGDFIFRNRVAGDKFSEEIAQFAMAELKAKTAAILYINQENGITYRDAFINTFDQLGGIVVISEAYEKGENDFKTQLTKINTKNPDVIYLAGQEPEYAIKQIKELGITAQLLGPLTIETPQLLKTAGQAAEGIYYSYPLFDPYEGTEKMKQFNQLYHSKFGEDAEGYAAYGYDATMVIADALKQCEQNDTLTICIRDYLYHIKNYEGVTGNISFDEYGEVIQPLTVKTVKDGQFVKLK
ncbi:ABC transporter substrate-binding protein [Candidatus Woesearchaeota archaeon]|nr:ABC transporter substrate-binding protein [Candidatus Woesearchaeota archaeon]